MKSFSKNQQLSIFITILFLHCSFLNQAQHACGTVIEEVRDNVKEQDRKPYKQYLAQYKQAAAHRKSYAMVDNIPVQLYIIGEDDGSGRVALADVQNALTDMNTRYAPADLSFYLCSPEIYIDDSDLYNFDNDTDLGLLHPTYYKDNVINLYFAGTVGSSGGTACGFVSYSATVQDNYIFMDNACINGSTLEHEFGHYFGLAHTHGKFNADDSICDLNVNGFPADVECKGAVRYYDANVFLDDNTDGINDCLQTGDNICDTPAEPMLIPHVNGACMYTGTVTDHFGDTYSPDIGNIMSYGPDACTPFFTTEQYAQIRYTFENFRGYLSCGGCTTFTVRTVTNTNNNGVGSLRWAIDCANSTSGYNLVDFNIPGVPPFTINLTSELPPLLDNDTEIDATTQPGWYKGAVIVDGTNVNEFQFADGLTIVADNSAVYGLRLTAFPHNGIEIDAENVSIGAVGKGNIIDNNGRIESTGNGVRILDCTGTQVIANDLNDNFAGVYITNAQDITIGATGSGNGNWISGGSGNGISIFSNCSNIDIVNNFIGTNATATAAYANDYNGITISESTDVRVGGLTAAERNIIAGNGTRGIVLDLAERVDIYNNYIGMNNTGTASIPNEAQGILLLDSKEVTIGTNTSTGNLISGNTLNGIYLFGTTDNTVIKGNIIGLDINQANAFPNYHGIVIDGVINTTIGGSGALEYNVVSGNTYQGVYVYIATDGCQITNNFLGTNSALSASFGNNYGIIVQEAQNVDIVENNIYYNNNDGIYIFETSSNVKLTENSFYCNGVDDFFIDSNSNTSNLITPVITQSSTVMLEGTSAPLAYIELFKDDPSCVGCEAKEFIGFTSANTSGNWSYTSPATITLGDFIKVTATVGQETTNPSSCTEIFCPAVWTIPHDPIPTNSYHAANVLTAVTPVAAANDVHIFAGDCINMDSGFEVPPNTTFSAEIQTCPTN